MSKMAPSRNGMPIFMLSNRYAPSFDINMVPRVPKNKYIPFIIPLNSGFIAL